MSIQMQFLIRIEALHYQNDYLTFQKFDSYHSNNFKLAEQLPARVMLMSSLSLYNPNQFKLS